MKINYYDKKNCIIASASLHWYDITRITIIKRFRGNTNYSIVMKPYGRVIFEDIQIFRHSNYVTINVATRASQFGSAAHACKSVVSNIKFQEL